MQQEINYQIMLKYDPLIYYLGELDVHVFLLLRN